MNGCLSTARRLALRLCMVSVLFLAGCGSFGPIAPYPSKKNPEVTQEDMRRHVILVDPDGDFYEIPERVDGRDLPIKKHAAENRDLRQQVAAMEKAYKGIFEGIDSFAESRTDRTKPLNVTIVIHGGLMTPEQKIEDQMEALALMSEDEVYPVFINWHSEAVTTMMDHFLRVRNGEVSRSKITYVTAAPYMALYVVKAVGEAPLAWWRSLKHYSLGTAQPVTRNASPPPGWNATNRFHAAPSEDYRYKWRDGPLYILGLPSRFIMTPFIYSWGAAAWKNMARRTHTMFIRQKDLDPDRNLLKPHTAPPGVMQTNGTPGLMPRYADHVYGAVYYFSIMLSNELERRRVAGGDNLWAGMQINLIGYSMGGIAVNHILMTTPDLPIANVVYMASADNLQNYLDIPVEYVKAKAHHGADVHVYNLFLHPKNDNTELNYGSLVPPGSLLTWVDHSYEQPEYVLQRTAGRWENMRLILKVINDQGMEDHFHYKVFGRNKTNRTQPQRHIDFDKARYRYWCEEFWR